jgi:hypothetical protein
MYSYPSLQFFGLKPLQGQVCKIDGQQHADQGGKKDKNKDDRHLGRVSGE